MTKVDFFALIQGNGRMFDLEIVGEYRWVKGALSVLLHMADVVELNDMKNHHLYRAWMEIYLPMNIDLQ